MMEDRLNRTADRRFRGPSLNVVTQDHIKDFIIDNDLKPGDPLPSEGEFAQELGISRGPVREAVKSLESLGIIEVRHGEGLFVREWNFDPVLATLQFGMRVSPKTLMELYQIRKWLEIAVIGDAVKRVSEDDLMQLDILMLQWERAIKVGEEYIQFDEEFHRIILGTLQNQTLMKLFSSFWLAFYNHANGELYSPDHDWVIQAHRKVVEAIKTRDPELARQALQEQFLGFQERIKKNLNQEKQRKGIGNQV